MIPFLLINYLLNKPNQFEIKYLIHREIRAHDCCKESFTYDFYKENFTNFLLRFRFVFHWLKDMYNAVT